jgi:hypothetical protein
VGCRPLLVGGGGLGWWGGALLGPEGTGRVVGSGLLVGLSRAVAQGVSCVVVGGGSVGGVSLVGCWWGVIPSSWWGWVGLGLVVWVFFEMCIVDASIL